MCESEWGEHRQRETKTQSREKKRRIIKVKSKSMAGAMNLTSELFFFKKNRINRLRQLQHTGRISILCWRPKQMIEEDSAQSLSRLYSTFIQFNSVPLDPFVKRKQHETFYPLESISDDFEKAHTIERIMYLFLIFRFSFLGFISLFVFFSSFFSLVY